MCYKTVSIPVFVMREEGELYGSFADMSESGGAECIVQTSIEGTGSDYGYPCDIDKGIDAIGAINTLYDSCELNDLMMVFFTAGLRAGLKHKSELEREPAEEATSADRGAHIRGLDSEE